MEIGLEFKQIVDEYKQIRSQSYKKGLMYIRKKCAEAKEVMDKVDYTCLQYYLAEALLYNNRGVAGIKIALYVTKTLYNVKPHRRELVMAYNLMGNDSMYQNPMVALENYLNALKLAEDNGFKDIIRTLYNNIGCMYMVVKDNKKAIPYLEKAWKNLKETEASNYMKFYILYNLALSNFELGNKNKFQKYFKLLEAVVNESGSRTVETLYLWIRICNDCYSGDLDKAEADIKQIVLRSKNDGVGAEILCDCIIFVDGWIKYKFYDYALEALECLENCSINNNYFAAQRDVVALRIEAYKLLDKEDLVVSEMKRYYEISRKTEQVNHEVMANSFDARIKVKHLTEEQALAQQETKRMKEKSEMDSLTGLSNRYVLDEFLKNKFQGFIDNGNIIGMEIVDIDYFKQYNDTYGHLAGDECLKKIANILKEIQDKNTLIMRYGGDEFVVIYLNKTKEEVAQKANRLKQLVKEANIEHKGSFSSEKVLTVTQGIHVGIPEKGQSGYDFIRLVDLALYDGKIERGSIIYYKKREPYKEK